MIPFREEREKLFVKARINGRINIDLVLDTGAEMTVLSEDAAQRAQVYSVAETLSAGVGDVGLRRLKLARINKLEIGTLKIEHVPTMIKDPPLKKFPTADIDAFSPLAVGLSMRVDYEKKQVIVARTLPKAEGTATMEAPLWMHRLATVRGRLNGDRPAAFVIDTGGQAISISRTAAVGLEQLGRFRRIPLAGLRFIGLGPRRVPAARRRPRSGRRAHGADLAGRAQPARPERAPGLRTRWHPRATSSSASTASRSTSTRA